MYKLLVLFFLVSFFNAAWSCELDNLEIGKAKKKLIEEYLRYKNISRITELLNIKGIGENTIRKIEKVCNMRVDEKNILPNQKFSRKMQ